MVVVLSDNGGTSSSTITLRKLMFSLPELVVVGVDSPFEQDLCNPGVSSKGYFFLRPMSSNLETRLETLRARTCT